MSEPEVAPQQLMSLAGEQTGMSEKDRESKTLFFPEELSPRAFQLLRQDTAGE